MADAQNQPDDEHDDQDEHERDRSGALGPAFRWANPAVPRIDPELFRVAFPQPDPEIFRAALPQINPEVFRTAFTGIDPELFRSQIQRLMQQVAVGFRPVQASLFAEAIENMRAQLRPATPSFSHLFGQQAWEVLSESLPSIGQAIQLAETQGPLEVPDELVADFEEPAREFAAAEGRGLSWEKQRELFAYFMGMLVLAMLVQAMVQHEIVKEVLEDGTAASPVVGLVYWAAKKAWERVNPAPEGNDADEEQEQ